MKNYSKVINGEMVVKPANEITIKCNGFVLTSPGHENILNDGWELYSLEEEDVLKDLEEKKQLKIKEIEKYDTSDAVNVFYVNDIPMWLDKATRVGLRLRFETEIENGLSETTLWYDDMPFKLNLEKALPMLRTIELYASQCYDVTQLNIFNVKQFTTLEEIDNFLFKEKYPEILKFVI